MLAKQNVRGVVPRRKQMVENMYRVVLGRPLMEYNLSRIIARWKPDGVPVVVDGSFVPRSFGKQQGKRYSCYERPFVQALLSKRSRLQMVSADDCVDNYPA